MKIIISNASPMPIYEQIKVQIINQIMSDELEEGEGIPSIRSLAKDIRISIMTIKKAYDELEKEGYIKIVQGKGTFVNNKNKEFVKDKACKEIERHIDSIVSISKKYNIPKKDVLDIFEFIYGGKNE